MYAGRHLGRACDKHDPFRVEPRQQHRFNNSLVLVGAPNARVLELLQRPQLSSLPSPSHPRHDARTVLGMAL
jgi:hypothetical protein